MGNSVLEALQDWWKFSIKSVLSPVYLVPRPVSVHHDINIACEETAVSQATEESVITTHGERVGDPQDEQVMCVCMPVHWRVFYRFIASKLKIVYILIFIVYTE